MAAAAVQGAGIAERLQHQPRRHQLQIRLTHLLFKFFQHFYQTTKYTKYTKHIKADWRKTDDNYSSDESYAIMGACFEVYREKGCGYLEAVYQECLEIEFAAK